MLLQVQKRYAEDRAVGGDERQEHAQQLVEQRALRAHHELGQLHDACDQQDERERAQILQPEGREKPRVNRPAEPRSYGQHEQRRDRHPASRLDPAADAHERTEPEEVRQDEVVDESGAECEQHQIGHRSAPVYFTFMPGAAPESGATRKISAPPGPAASTIPSEMPKRILRGSRFATSTASRPTSSAASIRATRRSSFAKSSIEIRGCAAIDSCAEAPAPGGAFAG